MNGSLQLGLPSVSSTGDRTWRASRGLGFVRTVATWPMPVTVGLLLALVRHQLNQQRVSIVREFDTTLPPLWLDRTRIEHVFVNLFLNAMQAMPPGGTLTVLTFASTPFWSDSDLPAGVIVEVDDTGHGIMPEKAGKLCDPFFTTKPPGQGTGLGLPISRKIMEIHASGTETFLAKPGDLSELRKTLEEHIQR